MRAVLVRAVHGSHYHDRRIGIFVQKSVHEVVARTPECVGSAVVFSADRSIAVTEIIRTAENNDNIRVVIHAIAPAGGCGKRDVDAFLLEFCGTGSGFSDTSDRCVSNVDFDRLAVRVAEIVGKELS